MLKRSAVVFAEWIIVVSATGGCAVDRASVSGSDVSVASFGPDVVRTDGSGSSGLTSRAFLCHGTGKSRGYPYPERDTGPVDYRVSLMPARVVRLDEGHDADFCAAGGACDVVATADEVKAQVGDTPRSPGYSARFRLDLRSGTFTASGGGLDGGWSHDGVCRPAIVG